jgi:plasmid stabilization system protein ParE
VKVKLLRRAQRDLEEIQLYLMRDAPARVETLIDVLLARIERLADSGGSGARPRDARLRALGFRFIVQGRYLVFYKTTPRAVRVYRVIHSSRDYMRILR